MQRGQVYVYHRDRAFGFLSSGAGKNYREYFFHKANFNSGLPYAGQEVWFEAAPETKGKSPMAVNITAAEEVL
jgi:cold shock CspA family protein